MQKIVLLGDGYLNGELELGNQFSQVLRDYRMENYQEQNRYQDSVKQTCRMLWEACDRREG